MLDVEDMRDGVEHGKDEIAWIHTSTMPMDALTKHWSGCPPLDTWLAGQKCHFYDRASEAKFVGMVNVEECEELYKEKPDAQNSHVSTWDHGLASIVSGTHSNVAFSVLGQGLNLDAGLCIEHSKIRAKSCSVSHRKATALANNQALDKLSC